MSSSDALFEYTHRISSRAKHLGLRIEPNGSLVVVSPRKISATKIHTFINQHAEWITKNMKRVSKARDHSETATTVRLFGETYTKNVVYDQSKTSGVTISSSTLHINTYDPNQTIADTKTKKQLERFLRSTARSYILPRTEQLAEKMGITYKAVTLRQQKSRWGSCTSQGNLQFNWRLVHHPAAVIDYVIIHELAHRIEMNHSAAFWEIVAQHDKQYQAHRNWLKKRGMPVG